METINSAVRPGAGRLTDHLGAEQDEPDGRGPQSDPRRMAHVGNGTPSKEGLRRLPIGESPHGTVTRQWTADPEISIVRYDISLR